MLAKKLYLLLNKKKNPQTEEDWGLEIELTIDSDHVLLPENYDGTTDSDHDIAIVKVPEHE